MFPLRFIKKINSQTAKLMGKLKREQCWYKNWYRGYAVRILRLMVKGLRLWARINIDGLIGRANEFTDNDALVFSGILVHFWERGQSQRKSDTLYETALTMKQKGIILSALETYDSIKHTNLRPSLELIKRDYFELIKTMTPFFYEPEEITLEHKFVW